MERRIRNAGRALRVAAAIGAVNGALAFASLGWKVHLVIAVTFLPYWVYCAGGFVLVPAWQYAVARALLRGDARRSTWAVVPYQCLFVLVWIFSVWNSTSGGGTWMYVFAGAYGVASLVAAVFAARLLWIHRASSHPAPRPPTSPSAAELQASKAMWLLAVVYPAMMLILGVRSGAWTAPILTALLFGGAYGWLAWHNAQGRWLIGSAAVIGSIGMLHACLGLVSMLSGGEPLPMPFAALLFLANLVAMVFVFRAVAIGRPRTA